MTEYSFTLTYRLADDDRDTDALVERLGEAGSTDALVGTGEAGRLVLDFSRESDSAEQAMRSAFDEVKAAVPSATLVDVQFSEVDDMRETLHLLRSPANAERLIRSIAELEAGRGIENDPTVK